MDTQVGGGPQLSYLLHGVHLRLYLGGGCCQSLQVRRGEYVMSGYVMVDDDSGNNTNYFHD